MGDRQMRTFLAILLVAPSFAVAESTTGGVAFLDPLGYTKPAFISLTVPDEASAQYKYYVDMSAPTNIDNGSCSFSNPCRTITSVSGKTGTNGSASVYIYLKGNGRLNITGSTLTGTASVPIVVKPWPSDTTPAVMTASSTGGVSSANTISGSGIRHVIFDGGPYMLFHFQGSGVSGNENNYSVVVNSNDITLYRVRIDGQDSGGPSLGVATGDGVNTSNFRFLNSEIYNSDNYYGVYTGGGTNCESGNSGHHNLEFRNSIFRDIGGRGIQIEPRSRSGNTSTGLLISGNAFHNIGASILSHAVQLASACGASVNGPTNVYNNIMWDLAGGGVRIADWPNIQQISYNTIVDYAKYSGEPSLSMHGITCQSDGALRRLGTQRQEQHHSPAGQRRRLGLSDKQ